ncbi:hypothetical protein C8R47DRAFT_1081540 [Mycena vitilis]|nr:hypothetical protein C8R47DRAFT_1081540 [Mycena vitilis]
MHADAGAEQSRQLREGRYRGSRRVPGISRFAGTSRVTIRCVGPRAAGTRTTNEQGAEKPQSERPKKGEEEACTVRGKCEVEAKVVGVGKSVAKQEPGLMKVAEKNEKLNGSQWAPEQESRKVMMMVRSR